ncbi:MAG: hypothetical protein ACFB8W_12635 [Elainellaceae cyanobacterium]
MNPNQKNLRFPVWKYLNQELFNAEAPAILHPVRYWQVYKCHHLERCWSLTYQPERESSN